MIGIWEPFTARLEAAGPGKLLLAGQSLEKVDQHFNRIGQNRGTKRQRRLDTVLKQVKNSKNQK